MTKPVVSEPEVVRSQSGHCMIDAVRQSVGRVVIGQEAVVERVLIALLTGGHLLLQGGEISWAESFVASRRKRGEHSPAAVAAAGLASVR